MLRILIIHPWKRRGGEETGGQEGEGSKAESRRIRAASWDTGMSKACITVVKRTYIGEAILGCLRDPNEPGRGLRAVSLWTPNEALNLSYVPPNMPRTLIVRPWRGGGVEGTSGHRGRVQGPTKPIAATRGLRAGIQA